MFRVQGVIGYDADHTSHTLPRYCAAITARQALDFESGIERKDQRIERGFIGIFQSNRARGSERLLSQKRQCQIVMGYFRDGNIRNRFLLLEQRLAIRFPFLCLCTHTEVKAHSQTKTGEGAAAAKPPRDYGMCKTGIPVNRKAKKSNAEQDVKQAL